MMKSKFLNIKNKFSIRKLSIGAASVMIGATLGGVVTPVLADSVPVSSSTSVAPDQHAEKEHINSLAGLTDANEGKVEHEIDANVAMTTTDNGNTVVGSQKARSGNIDLTYDADTHTLTMAGNGKASEGSNYQLDGASVRQLLPNIVNDVTTIKITTPMTVVSGNDGLFSYLPKLARIDGMGNLTTVGLKDFSYMFAGDPQLGSVDLSNFNTAQATNMSHMFDGDGELNNIDLSTFDTSNVTNMNGMFNNTASVSRLDLGNKFDTTKVTDMRNMFNGMGSISNLYLGADFKTLNVTDMSGMFNGDLKLAKLDLGKGFNTSSVKDMSFMFANDPVLSSIAMGDNFRTGNVTSMRGMFTNDLALPNISLGSYFDTTNVKDMSDMFSKDAKLEKVDFGPQWSTKSVTDMSRMFMQDGKLGTLDLSGFETDKATKMTDMLTETGDIKGFNLKLPARYIAADSGLGSHMNRIQAVADGTVTKPAGEKFTSGKSLLKLYDGNKLGIDKAETYVMSYFSQADQYKNLAAKSDGITVIRGTKLDAVNGTDQAKAGLDLPSGFPTDAKFTWDASVDTSTVGNTSGLVDVTFADGTKLQVKVPVTVKNGTISSSVVEVTVPTKPAKEAKATVQRKLQHNAYLYNKEGEHINHVVIKAGSSVATTGDLVKIGGRKYYQVGTYFMAAGNFDSNSRLVLHNAYVYSKRGKRIGKKVIKRNVSVKTYGSPIKIKGNYYYSLGEGRYIKAANTKLVIKGYVYPTANETPNDGVTEKLVHNAYLYNEKGTAIAGTRLLKGSVVKAKGTLAINGRLFFDLGNKTYIAAGNIID